jgi:serine/threonine protein kinase
MAELDAVAVGQLAARLGLVTVDQLQEGLDEIGQRHGDADEYLRILERKGYLTPWQSAKLLRGESEGYFLGGYRILYKIASGTFGRVFRADDPRTGMIVAIKVLRLRWTDDRNSIELFEREGKVGMSLKHPNLVEILSVNHDPASNQYYIVMEFIEGGNLRDFIRIRKKVDALETVRILEDAASGLAHAYSQGVSHRDMKLTNVLISSTATAKLVDFGLAKLNEHKHGKEEIKVDRTVDYAGLEKATGAQPGDIRSDIYFLGCIGYELLTGRPPLPRTRDPQERMRSLRFHKVVPMRSDEVEAPLSVFHLIETMMALDPKQRYQTPSQLLDAIRAVRLELQGAAQPSNDNYGNTLFVVENDQRLQNGMRDRFRERGYRVLLSGDPRRALERYKQQPYDFLIVDAGTVGEDGLFLFDRIMSEASFQERPCSGVLILSEHQHTWANRIKRRPNAAILTRPVTIKQIREQLESLSGRKESK